MALEDEIRIENVSFRYRDELVLQNAHFHLDRGSFSSFIGPNGGGKTTLARLILGLLTPDEGYISVFGEPPQKASRTIGYVPQHTHHDPDFPITVNDVVLMGRLGKRFGSYTVADRRIASEVLEQAGMTEFSHRPFSLLSGGQKQRVLIARALATQPEILLLDEPTNNIDALSENRLYSLLRELNKKLTVILISHDLTFVAGSVDKVICVNRDVHIHPTADLNEASLRESLGRGLKMVQHDAHLEEAPHE